MSSNMALSITRDEWKEIEMLPSVQKTFEAELHTVGYLSEKIYGAKYVLAMYDTGAEVVIYTLVGLYTSGDIVLVLERENGVLKG